MLHDTFQSESSVENGKQTCNCMRTRTLTVLKLFPATTTKITWRVCVYISDTVIAHFSFKMRVFKGKVWRSSGQEKYWPLFLNFRRLLCSPCAMLRTHLCMGQRRGVNRGVYCEIRPKTCGPWACLKLENRSIMQGNWVYFQLQQKMNDRGKLISSFNPPIKLIF